MPASKADIVAHLRNEVLALQGFKQANHAITDLDLGPVQHAFPNATFPIGAVHEFSCAQREDVVASSGFIAGILHSLMKCGGVSLWISSSPTVFPPGLRSFGLDPDKIIFVNLKREKDILWSIQEALKCDSLTAVVGEIAEISFTESRRLQLAVEQSRVTGFILRRGQRQFNTTACVTRWKITHLPSTLDLLDADMPGVGFPRWNVELLKVRNGKPGSWHIEWLAGKFHYIENVASVLEQSRKVV
jgi:protein ImuA